ncbi:leucine-rich repeat extensin-like protein 2 isoform X3 [Hibiscus syriacus]|uniref:leucine-rich repeat extensin-like protein 2 isoform X2 n=1 Tax=Hibiscus syriacus TaxID=106335 RepID=UPI00192060BE|nr:leucine-rich repeat extensin-like protein 2 isoform X2 [Hibiscus syriacus]XP_039038770.1 leucine-rich repeat extensin-like protein 2 isoform X3 [Hibiscus syriacus]
MENYPYNSYPDSGDSSPRSREIEFENPPPWEDPSQQQQSYKAKFMCSYGGKIHPRPHDNQLSYIGGETKILSVDRNIKFSSMIAKLSALCGGGDGDVSFKYQLPGEDLDSLISVTNDDDLEHMMHEYDRLYRASAKPARMRLFVFPATGSVNFGREGSTHGGEKAATIPQSKVDFLFGLEKGMAPPPPVKIRDHVGEPVITPPPPVPEILGTDYSLNPGEIQRQIQDLQRLQIRDQEQMYRKKAEDAAASMPYTGEYYAQKLPEKVPPMTVQQHAPVTAGYWPDKHISSGSFQTTITAAPGPPHPADNPVYMIPAPVPGQAPATLYHAPPPVPAPAPAPAPPQMVRPVTGQAGQGYYTNVLQRMPQEVYRDQPIYNMVSQQPPPQQPPPPTQHHPVSTIPHQAVRSPSGGVTDAAYTHAAAYDRPNYYTSPGAVVPPQYQGVGVAVSGEKRGTADNSKVVYKVSQGSV